jgi:cytochrome c peroxidase
MHDGRFLTLDAVLEHYTNGVQQSPTLDPQLQQPGHTGISISTEEKIQLLAFLKTLDDRVFITDRRFSEQ